MPSNFIFQQDGAPAHGARLAQDWLAAHCSDFIDKDSWPPNSPDLNPLDYHVWGAMLDKFDKLNPKTTDSTRTEANTADNLERLIPKMQFAKLFFCFVKRLDACVKAGGGHF